PSAKETSRVEGSCGRRPMITTSKSSRLTVTMMVVHHTQVATFIGTPPERQARQALAGTFAPEVSSAQVFRAHCAGARPVMTAQRSGNTPLRLAPLSQMRAGRASRVSAAGDDPVRLRPHAVRERYARLQQPAHLGRFRATSQYGDRHVVAGTIDHDDLG